MSLAGKVAIVTGAARGAGRACAVALARAGADVLLLDIGHDLAGVPYPLGSESQLALTAELCREFGHLVLSELADMRDSAAVGAAVETALDRFGRIDVLVNNAGIAAPSGKVVHGITEDEWALMIDVDLSGAWRAIRAVAPTMVRQRSGSIVNIASTAGMVGYRNFAGYVTAKHGLVGLTKAAALDYAPFQIRVNAVCPGNIRDAHWVEGRMLSEVARSLGVSTDDHETLFTRDQPMNILVEPDDVASATVWLASAESSRVTGSILTVDGGFTAH
ncbi:SDR family oxidoreductase [Nocardia sp. NPDC050712]|uniref:SDR family oxidoreductase n=1 Tax=Nocardia sp. NPDC050712 TaxID=3155518 RepID=UPI0033E0D22B